uniref:NADH-ubiquinone oxidoreductase chain 4 n=1 Tax=Cucullanus robustus TaxID=657293 RepID=G4V250_9BILA|nr:NADH dehydrogenase subunit 4 [Cucullanus robustus]ACV96767.1 NADH dehydrogenase subunit 4 [Cucullanus robustus]
MIFLFMLFFFFLFSPMVFYLISMILTFSMLNNFSWGGVFIFLDSYNFILLIIMSVFILGFVLISEKNYNLVLLSEILVFFCILFFVPGSMLFLYIYFELSIFPILVMILGYGSQIEKIGSSYYLIFYAAFCSLPFLFIYFSSVSLLSVVYFDLFMSWELVFVLSLSFMMKFPVYFLHLWLPKAHVEAPTTASMLLAGLLLKLGTAGFLRILGSLGFVNVSVWLLLSFLGMILAAFSCIYQSDAKSLAAYSSVCHMSFLLMLIIMLGVSMKVGGVILMLGHGYTSTLLFFLVGEYFHVSGSRMVYYMGGFMLSSIFCSILFSLILLSNSGVPPSLSFVVEFMGVSSIMVISTLGFGVMLLYFFVSFYYSLFLLTNSLMGKSLLDLNIFSVSLSVSLILMMFNIFWLSVLF